MCLHLAILRSLSSGQHGMDGYTVSLDFYAHAE